MRPLDYPLLMLVVSFGVFWASALIGSSLRKRKPALGEDYHDEFMFVLGGTLTLLGLIIAFTFSMAVNRYDQRKNYEEQEANAIGTEYVRSDLLPPEDATKVRALLKSYLRQRIAEYRTRGAGRLQELGARTANLQAELWSAVARPASTKPTPINAVLVLGMNEVLNSQSYTQASWWNRIPTAAWALVTLISVCDFTHRLGHSAFPDSRHRQSARRSHSRATAESGKSRGIPPVTVNAKCVVALGSPSGCAGPFSFLFSGEVI